MKESFIIVYVVGDGDVCDTIVQMLHQGQPKKHTGLHHKEHADLGSIVRSQKYHDSWQVGAVNLAAPEAYDEGIRCFFLEPLGQYRVIEEGEVFDVT